jgi:signal transduction histidine kinase
MAMTLALYAGIVLMIFFWLLPLTTRLHKLTELAAAFGCGDLSKRVRLSNFSYIDGLEKSFNHMASRIETLVADNKILAGSLSHDLRTPLACLRFGVEAAMDTNQQTKKNNYLERVNVDLTRLEDMLEAFLEYASLEQTGINLVKRNINIHQLTLSVVDELQPLARDAKITLSIVMNIHAETTIYADNHWVYRALLNVLSNALEHANSRIIIDISSGDNNMIVIAVNDDGRGIHDIDKAVIFTPFSKGDESRNQNQQHYGLGLAIVSKVMEWHKGRIYADESTILPGACFAMHLPLNLN